MPKSTRTPRAENTFSDCRKIKSDSSANGTVSGSADRMVTGWSQLSNCAAMTRYMKTMESTIAVRKATAAFRNSRA